MNRFGNKAFAAVPASAAQSASSPYSVPFSLSLLVVESLFPDFYSPSSQLLIPFLRVDIPYGYFLLLIIQAITAFSVHSSAPDRPYCCVFPQANSSYPDFLALQQLYALDRTLNRVPAAPAGDGNGQDTPLLPKGITFNLLFSCPFPEPSKAASFYLIELKELKNIFGIFIPLAAILLYLGLRPLFAAKKNTASAMEPGAAKEKSTMAGLCSLSRAVSCS